MPVEGLPTGLHLANVRHSDWLSQRLAPWGEQVRVRALLPAGFDAYLRILPPALAEDGRRWRWPAIAAATGAQLSAASRYNQIAGAGPSVNSVPQPWGRPPDGMLDEPELTALADILAGFTSTPQTAYICLWDGYGEPWVQALTSHVPERDRVEHRDYFLFARPVSAATTVLPLSPSLWWPQDRAWVLTTEIDGYNSYLAVGADAAAAVHNDPRLDAVPVDLDTPIDPSPWEPPADLGS